MADRRRRSPEGSRSRRSSSNNHDSRRSEYDNKHDHQRSTYDGGGPSRSRVSVSSSSSTSSSYLDISRTFPTRGNAIRAFFTAPSERRRLRKRRSNKVFKFSNSSSSSVNSDLAYGTGFIKKNHRNVRSWKGKDIDRENERERERYRDRESEGGRERYRVREGLGSGQGGRKPTTEEEILVIGAGLAKLAKDQNKVDLKAARNGSKPELVAVRESGRRHNGSSRGMGQSRISRGSDSFDEEGWESASDGESDTSVDPRLAFTDDSKISFWPFGKKKHKLLSRKSSVVDPRLFGRQNSLRGEIAEPTGFGDVTWTSTTDFGPQTHFPLPQHRENSANASQASLDRVFAVPTSDPGRFDAGRGSVVSSSDAYGSSRPGPAPVHSQPRNSVSSAPVSQFDAGRGSVVSSSDAYGSSRPGPAPMRPQPQNPVPFTPGSQFDVGRGSAVSSSDAYGSSRPAPAPVQPQMHHPVPFTPVSQSVYEPPTYPTTRSDSGGILKKSTSSSGKTKSIAEAALIGVTGVVVGSAIADRRDDRTEKQRREDERKNFDRSKRHDSTKKDSKDDRKRRDSPDREDRKEREKRREKESKKDGKKDNKKDSSSRVSSNDKKKHRDETRDEKEKRHEKRREDRRSERGDDTRSDRGEDRYDSRHTRSETAVSQVPQNFVDPFQYQLDNTTKTTISAPDLSRVESMPSVPTVYTVDRVPDFARQRSASLKDAPTTSRIDSQSFQEYDDNQERYRDSVSRNRDDGRRTEDTRDRTLHDAEQRYSAVEHSTAPIDAAIIGAAFSAVADEGSRESRSTKRRVERRHEQPSDYDDYNYRPRENEPVKERDLIQEEADRAYREIVLARKIASQVIRSRSPSPNRSVTNKYQYDDEPEEVQIVTPPEMKEHERKKGLYDAPNADFKPDYILTDPRELRNFSIPTVGHNRSYSEADFLKRDPDASLPRPHLNLVHPTPSPSPLPEKQTARSEPGRKSKSKDREQRQQSRSSSSDVVIDPKGNVVQSPSASAVSKGVTWGRNETKHFEVESPGEHKDEFVSSAENKYRDSPEEPISPKIKSKGWGAIAAGIVGAGAVAAAASSSETSKTSKFKENEKKQDVPYEYRGITVEPEAPSRSQRQASPPSPGPKPYNSQSSRIPGAFNDDLDFAAHVAAGLQDSGFDPNIVINDPAFSRRDSPPGSNEPAIYRPAYAETVTDLGIAASGNNGDQGFIMEEVAKTPEERRSISPKGNDYSKLSKKEQKKLDKEKRRQSTEVVPVEESNTVSEIVEEPDTYWEAPKLTKKEQKEKIKLEKERRRQSTEAVPVEEPIAVREIAEESDTYFVAPKLSKKQQMKLDKEKQRQSTEVVPIEEPTTAREIVEEPETYFVAPKLTKKEQKVRDKAAKESSLAGDFAPLPETPVAPEIVEEPESYFEAFEITKKSKKKSKKGLSSHDDHLEDSSRKVVTAPADAFDYLQQHGDDDWEEPKTPKKSNRDSDRFDSPSRSVQSPKIDAELERDTRVTSKKPKLDSERYDSPSRSEAGVDLERSSSKKSKDKSKRRSEVFDPDPTEVSLPPSTPSETSRDGGDYHESRKSRKSNRESGIFDSGNRDDSRSVISTTSRHEDDEHRRKKKSRSSTRDDFDDTRSVASAPAGDEAEKKKKDKKSGGGFFGLFGSKSEVSARDESPRSFKDDPEDAKKKSKKEKRRSVPDTSSLYGGIGAASVSDLSRSVSNGNGNGNGSRRYDDLDDGVRSDGERKKSRSRAGSTSSKKDSFLGNAGTLGAGAGLAGAAVAIAAQRRSHSRAANVNNRQTVEQQHGRAPSSERALEQDELFDPEITERHIRPSIDPQYGDLLPLPPSDPVSPNLESIDNLPDLPESRPDTPEVERLPKSSIGSFRKSYEAPMKSPSQSAVPLKFIMGSRSTPSSPGITIRSPPVQSPDTPTHESLTFPKSRVSRPTSWDSTREFKPLYLVESNRRLSNVRPDDEEPLPELPLSQSTSRSSSQHEYDEQDEELNPADQLFIDTALASYAGADLLSSGQSTPKAGFVSRDFGDMTGPPSESRSLEDVVPKAIVAAGIATTLGYFASSPSQRLPKENWMEDLPSVKRRTSPVDPMSKGGSSSMLNSSLVSRQYQDGEFTVHDDYSPSSRQKSFADGNTLHSSEDREGSDTFDQSRNFSQAPAVDEEADKFSQSTFKSKKDKKKDKEKGKGLSRSSTIQDDVSVPALALDVDIATDVVGVEAGYEPELTNSLNDKTKKGKGLSRSATLDDVYVPEINADVTLDSSLAAESLDQLELLKSKKDKKKDKKKGKTEGAWDEPTYIAVEQRPEESLAESAKDLPAEELAVPEDNPVDDFALPKSKKDKKKDKKKGKSMSWDESAEEVIMQHPEHLVPELNRDLPSEESNVMEADPVDEFSLPKSKKDKKKKDKSASWNEPVGEISTQQLAQDAIPGEAITDMRKAIDNVAAPLDADILHEFSTAKSKKDEKKIKKGKSTSWDESVHDDTTQELEHDVFEDAYESTPAPIEADEFSVPKSKKDKKKRKSVTWEDPLDDSISQLSVELSDTEFFQDALDTVHVPPEVDPVDTLYAPKSKKDKTKSKKGKSLSWGQYESDAAPLIEKPVQEPSQEPLPEKIQDFLLDTPREFPIPTLAELDPVEDFSTPKSKKDKKRGKKGKSLGWGVEDTKAVPAIEEPIQEPLPETVQGSATELTRELAEEPSISNPAEPDLSDNFFAPTLEKDKRKKKKKSTSLSRESEENESPLVAEEPVSLPKAIADALPETARETPEETSISTLAELDTFDEFSAPKSKKDRKKGKKTKSWEPEGDEEPAPPQEPEADAIQDLPESVKGSTSTPFDMNPEDEFSTPKSKKDKKKGKKAKSSLGREPNEDELALQFQNPLLETTEAVLEPEIVTTETSEDTKLDDDLSTSKSKKDKTKNKKANSDSSWELEESKRLSQTTLELQAEATRKITEEAPSLGDAMAEDSMLSLDVNAEDEFSMPKSKKDKKKGKKAKSGLKSELEDESLPQMSQDPLPETIRDATEEVPNIDDFAEKPAPAETDTADEFSTSKFKKDKKDKKKRKSVMSLNDEPQMSQGREASLTEVTHDLPEEPSISTPIESEEQPVISAGPAAEEDYSVPKSKNDKKKDKKKGKSTMAWDDAAATQEPQGSLPESSRDVIENTPVPANPVIEATPVIGDIEPVDEDFSLPKSKKDKKKSKKSKLGSREAETDEPESQAMPESDLASSQDVAEDPPSIPDDFVLPDTKNSKKRKGKSISSWGPEKEIAPTESEPREVGRNIPQDAPSSGDTESKKGSKKKTESATSTEEPEPLQEMAPEIEPQEPEEAEFAMPGPKKSKKKGKRSQSSGLDEPGQSQDRAPAEPKGSAEPDLANGIPIPEAADELTIPSSKKGRKKSNKSQSWEVDTAPHETPMVSDCVIPLVAAGAELALSSEILTEDSTTSKSLNAEIPPTESESKAIAPDGLDAGYNNDQLSLARQLQEEFANKKPQKDKKKRQSMPVTPDREASRSRASEDPASEHSRARSLSIGPSAVRSSDSPVADLRRGLYNEDQLELPRQLKEDFGSSSKKPKKDKKKGKGLSRTLTQDDDTFNGPADEPQSMASPYEERTPDLGEASPMRDGFEAGYQEDQLSLARQLQAEFGKKSKKEKKKRSTSQTPRDDEQRTDYFGEQSQLPLSESPQLEDFSRAPESLSVRDGLAAGYNEDQLELARQLKEEFGSGSGKKGKKDKKTKEGQNLLHSNIEDTFTSGSSPRDMEEGSLQLEPFDESGPTAIYLVDDFAPISKKSKKDKKGKKLASLPGGTTEDGLSSGSPQPDFVELTQSEVVTKKPEDEPAPISKKTKKDKKGGKRDSTFEDLSRDLDLPKDDFTLEPEPTTIEAGPSMSTAAESGDDFTLSAKQSKRDKRGKKLDSSFDAIPFSDTNPRDLDQSKNDDLPQPEPTEVKIELDEPVTAEAEDAFAFATKKSKKDKKGKKRDSVLPETAGDSAPSEEHSRGLVRHNDGEISQPEPAALKTVTAELEDDSSFTPKKSKKDKKGKGRDSITPTITENRIPSNILAADEILPQPDPVPTEEDEFALTAKKPKKDKKGKKLESIMFEPAEEISSDFGNAVEALHSGDLHSKDREVELVKATSPTEDDWTATSMKKSKDKKNRQSLATQDDSWDQPESELSPSQFASIDEPSTAVTTTVSSESEGGNDPLAHFSFPSNKSKKDKKSRKSSLRTSTLVDDILEQQPEVQALQLGQEIGNVCSEIPDPTPTALAADAEDGRFDSSSKKSKKGKKSRKSLQQSEDPFPTRPEWQDDIVEELDTPAFLPEDSASASTSLGQSVLKDAKSDQPHIETREDKSEEIFDDNFNFNIKRSKKDMKKGKISSNADSTEISGSSTPLDPISETVKEKFEPSFPVEDVLDQVTISEEPPTQGLEVAAPEEQAEEWGSLPMKKSRKDKKSKKLVHSSPIEEEQKPEPERSLEVFVEPVALEVEASTPAPITEATRDFGEEWGSFSAKKSKKDKKSKRSGFSTPIKEGHNPDFEKPLDSPGEPQTGDLETTVPALEAETVLEPREGLGFVSAKQSKKDGKKKKSGLSTPVEVMPEPETTAVAPEEPINRDGDDAMTTRTNDVVKEPEDEYLSAKKSKKDGEKRKSGFSNPVEPTREPEQETTIVAAEKRVDRDRDDETTAPTNDVIRDPENEYFSAKKSKKDKKKNKKSGFSTPTEDNFNLGSAQALDEAPTQDLPPVVTLDAGPETQAGSGFSVTNPKKDKKKQKYGFSTPLEEISVASELEPASKSLGTLGEPLTQHLETLPPVTTDATQEPEDEWSGGFSSKKSKKDKKKGKSSSPTLLEVAPVITELGPALQTSEELLERDNEILEPVQEPEGEQDSFSTKGSKKHKKKKSKSGLSTPIEEAPIVTESEQGFREVEEQPSRELDAAKALQEIVDDKIAFSTKKSKKDKKRQPGLSAPLEELPTSTEQENYSEAFENSQSQDAPISIEIVPQAEDEWGGGLSTNKSKKDKKKRSGISTPVEEPLTIAEPTFKEPQSQNLPVSNEAVNEPEVEWGGGSSTKKSKKDKKKSGPSTPVQKPDIVTEPENPLEVLEELDIQDPETSAFVYIEPTSQPELEDDSSAFSTMKSKKDKKKSKRSGLSTPVEATEPNIFLEESKELESQDNDVKTPILTETIPTPEPADELGSSFIKKPKKDKKNRKSGLSTPSEEFPTVANAEPIEASQPIVPEPVSPERNVTETQIEDLEPHILGDVSEPVETTPTDDGFGFVSKKPKKDKKKSGNSTPLEDSFVPEPEPAFESADRDLSLAQASEDIFPSSVKILDARDDEFGGFASKKSKKDKKKNKSGSSTPFEDTLVIESQQDLESSDPNLAQVNEDTFPAPVQVQEAGDNTFSGFATKSSKKDKKKNKSGTSTLFEDTLMPETQPILESSDRNPVQASEITLQASVQDSGDDGFGFATTKKPKKDKKGKRVSRVGSESGPSTSTAEVETSMTPERLVSSPLPFEHERPPTTERALESETLPQSTIADSAEEVDAFPTELPRKTSKKDKRKRQPTVDANIPGGAASTKTPVTSWADEVEEAEVVRELPIIEDIAKDESLAHIASTTDATPLDDFSRPTKKGKKGKKSQPKDFESTKDSFRPPIGVHSPKGKQIDHSINIPVLAATGAALAGATISSKSIIAKEEETNTPTRKPSKKEKKKKSIDRRSTQKDDIFDDPALWEGADPKVFEETKGVDDDAGSDGFWSPPQDDQPTETTEEPIDMGQERDISHEALAHIEEASYANRDISSKAQLPPSSDAPRDLQRPDEQLLNKLDDSTTNFSKKDKKKIHASALDSEETTASRDVVKPDLHRSFSPVKKHTMQTGQDMLSTPKRADEGLSADASYESSPFKTLSSSKFALSGFSDLPAVMEENTTQMEAEHPRLPHIQDEDANRDSAFVSDSPIPRQRGFADDHEPIRDSGVHLRDFSPSKKTRETVSSSDDALARLSWPSVNDDIETVDLSKPQRPSPGTIPKLRNVPQKRHDGEITNRDQLPSQKSKDEKPTDLRPTETIHGTRPPKENSLVQQRVQRLESPDFTRSDKPKPDKYGGLTSAKRQLADKPKVINDHSLAAAAAIGTAASLGFAAARKSSLENRPDSAASQRSLSSNINRLRTPDPKFRPDSVGSNRTSTPPLRRSDRKISGDLRSLSQRSNLDLAKDVELETTASTINVANPTANEGRVRAKDMADVYDGFGEGRIGSPRSPTRPHSMRRRQSMQVLDLESKLEQLAAENRMLAEAHAQAERSLQSSQRVSSSVVEKDAEIDSLKRTLDWLQNEVTRLTEVNDGLASANVTLGNQHNDRYGMLETQHAQATRELQQVRKSHDNLSSGMEGILLTKVQNAVQDKDREIAELRNQLEAAKEKIREMQRQILSSKADVVDFLTVKDEDYFDNSCQQLCQHVQQWVLRFSKFSDMRACRLTSEINNDKTIDRLDNAILDGSDIDGYLSDRIKRRDVFMSMTMTMVWEFVFTRYLFGMDREQRQKLKSLEKLLLEVGPAAAVHQWRATTLTLLSKREAFVQQREQDTQAVVHAILETLSEILPPPSHLEAQIEEQLKRVMKAAVDLSIEMRTQRAEYMMLPPLQPEYDANGDLASKVSFNAALMNERSGETGSNEELEASKAVVRVVLFPLVVKKGDDRGEGDEEIVVCPAQVLVAKPKKHVRVFSPGSMAGGNNSRVSMQSSMPADYGDGSVI